MNLTTARVLLTSKHIFSHLQISISSKQSLTVVDTAYVIIDARFDTPVLRNGNVEMASTGSIIQSTGFLKLDTCQIDAKFDTPVPRNGSNVQVEMVSTNR